MQRWNGWGDESIYLDLPTGGLQILRDLVGEGHNRPDYSLENFIERIPGSRLDPHPLISFDSKLRLDHAHGQSLPLSLAAGGRVWSAISRCRKPVVRCSVCPLNVSTVWSAWTATVDWQPLRPAFAAPSLNNNLIPGGLPWGIIPNLMIIHPLAVGWSRGPAGNSPSITAESNGFLREGRF